jgi:predicted PurR-regulated permease PerM
LFVLSLSLFIAFIFPPLLRESSVFLQNVQIPLGITQQLENFEVNFDSIRNILDALGTSVSTALSIISSTFSGAFIAITTLVIAIYFSLEKPRLIKDLAKVFNRDKEEAIRSFFNEVDNQLGNWIRGQIILMTIIGATTFVGLVLIGVPYALPLAIIAGLLEIVPNIGPIFSAIPAVIVASLAFGWPTALATAVFYLVVQQIENSIIVPKIMKANVDINPLVSILGILVGAKVFGVVGALLAVPIFIVFRTVYTTWKKYLK